MSDSSTPAIAPGSRWVPKDRTDKRTIRAMVKPMMGLVEIVNVDTRRTTYVTLDRFHATFEPEARS